MGGLTPPPPLRASLSAPVAFDSTHDVSLFDCGKEPLNDWLKERAAGNEGRSSRCFVVCEGREVVAYYCTAAGSVERDKLPKKLQRNMPQSVPVIIIGRMAVDKRKQGFGIGHGLLKDALLRILNASREIGARAILVHAIDDDVVPFYRNHGFLPFPTDARTLFLPLETIVAGL